MNIKHRRLFIRYAKEAVMHMAKRTILCGLMLTLIFIISAIPNANTIWASGGKVKLSLWSYTDELQIVIDRFEEENPGISVDLKKIPYEEYLDKLKPVLRSGSNAPDLFLGEYSHVVELVETRFWDDLSSWPYKADVSDMYPFTVEAGTDSKGKLRALSWQAAPGGFFYRRSLAKKYLGTDDPDKVGGMLSTPDRFLETARKLKHKSDGAVKIIAGYADYQHYPFAARTKPFAAGGVLAVEQPVSDYFDLAKTMHDERLTADIATWSPPWFDEMKKKDSGVFGYILPWWGLHYVITPNARDTMGDWGLCEGPAVYFWGGTWVGIYRYSTHKELAWQFVRFMTLDRDSQKWWAIETGDFVSSKTVVDRIKGDFSAKLLDGQNHYEFYARLVNKIDGSLLKQYELDIRNFLMGAIRDYVQGKLTKERAIKQFKEDVQNAFPDIEVE
jgi:multiple sugar transport system substrate-binding protein